MRKAEIDALMRAHGGRARPVAFFHVLRQAALTADDHAFLTEHITDLGATDLLRWRARCEPGFTGVVIRRLADMAIADPTYFEHDFLNVPRLVLDTNEWIELEDLTRGKVPERVHARICERGRRAPLEHQGNRLFSPGKLATRERFFFEEDPDLAFEPPDMPLRDRSLAGILAARRDGTLAVGEPELLRLAMERAKSAAEDWSLAVIDFPETLRDAVLEKARRSRSDAERANLLVWLESRGAPRAALFGIALEAIRGGRCSYGLITWLSRQLVTRAAWEKHGYETLSALVGQRGFSEVGEIVTMAWSEAALAGAEPPRGLLEAIQGAFALVLIRLTHDALTRGDEPRALAALSSLASLDPPSRVSRAVHDLSRLPGLSAEVRELIAVNERLVKHGDARDASLEGVVSALHAIADSYG
ncbi:MAG: hypothetical protein R3B70_02855 [Polyangiaceae bacterium]